MSLLLGENFYVVKVLSVTDYMYVHLFQNELGCLVRKELKVSQCIFTKFKLTAQLCKS